MSFMKKLFGGAAFGGDSGFNRKMFGKGSDYRPGRLGAIERSINDPNRVQSLNNMVNRPNSIGGGRFGGGFFSRGRRRQDY